MIGQFVWQLYSIVNRYQRFRQMSNFRGRKIYVKNFRTISQNWGTRIHIQIDGQTFPLEFINFVTIFIRVYPSGYIKSKATYWMNDCNITQLPNFKFLQVERFHPLVQRKKNCVVAWFKHFLVTQQPKNIKRK